MASHSRNVSGLALAAAGVATVGYTVAFVPSATPVHPVVVDPSQSGFLSQSPVLAVETVEPQAAGISWTCGAAAMVTACGAVRIAGARAKRVTTRALPSDSKLFKEDGGQLRFSDAAPPCGIRGFAPGSKAATEAAAIGLGEPSKAVVREVREVRAPRVLEKRTWGLQVPVPVGMAVTKTSAGNYAGVVGDTAPFKYWDPLGLANMGDDADFRRRRVAEIKNGRVAMLACMGWIAPEYFRWPGYVSKELYLKFTDVPNGMAALYKIPVDGWAQIGVFIAFLELFPMRQENTRVPGDFKGCGRLGVPWFFVAGRDGSTCDPVGSRRSLDSELNNGRLAMVAITGMVFQEGMAGTTGADMWFPAGALRSD